MPDESKPLSDLRVLSALNGLELFGHERGNIEVFKVLRELGVEVIVGVNSKNDNNVRAELRRLEFKTFDLPFGPQWSIQWVKKQPSIALTNMIAAVHCSQRFIRVAKRFGPTHVHLGSPLVYSYLGIALALIRARVIYRMGDCPPIDSPFNLRLWRMAMRRTNCIVSNSEFVKREALNAGAKNISVIYNLAPSSVDVDEERVDRCTASGSLSIVYVGSVSERKGLLPLVESFARLVSELPHLRLLIVGGSRYDNDFRTRLMNSCAMKKVSGNVEFCGHVEDPSPFFRFSAVHVAPSLWEEPAANVVLEAKREATPSVVFPSGGLPELVRHRVDGYICKDKSVDALVEGLRWMLEDPGRLKRMANAAQADSKARFGRERFARAWADIYRSDP